MLAPAVRGCGEQLGFIRLGLHVSYRYLNSAEVSTALRPFYFNVHPDLFGKYPEERVRFFTCHLRWFFRKRGFLQDVFLCR